jgi:hypothetical protein
MKKIHLVLVVLLYTFFLQIALQQTFQKLKVGLLMAVPRSLWLAPRYI